MNKLFLTKRASKEFGKLSPLLKKQVGGVIDDLEKDPSGCDIKKLKTPFEGYRVRSGNYRILCVIEKKEVVIYSIQHRKDAYRR